MFLGKTPESFADLAADEKKQILRQVDVCAGAVKEVRVDEKDNSIRVIVLENILSQSGDPFFKKYAVYLCQDKAFGCSFSKGDIAVFMSFAVLPATNAIQALIPTDLRRDACFIRNGSLLLVNVSTSTEIEPQTPRKGILSAIRKRFLRKGER